AALAFQETPRVHRDQSAEHPRQREHPEHEPDYMMPIEPAAVGREPPILAALELKDTKDDPDHGEEGAKQRGPDHGLAPELLLSAQRLEIEEMRDGAEPVPEPLHLRRPHDDLAGGAGDVDGGLVGIVEFEAVQRPVALRASDGELIEWD